MILTFEDGEDEILNHIIILCQYRNRGISIVCKCKEKFDFFGFGNRHHKSIGEKATGRNHFNIYRI